MSLFYALGGAGGVLVLLSGLVVLGRGIFKQVSATEANTDAVRELTGEVSTLKQAYNGLGTRLAVLEDRIKR